MPAAAHTEQRPCWSSVSAPGLGQREAGSPQSRPLAEELSPGVKTTKRAAIGLSLKNRSAPHLWISSSAGITMLSAHRSPAPGPSLGRRRREYDRCLQLSIFSYVSPVDTAYLCQQASGGQRWKLRSLHSGPVSCMWPYFHNRSDSVDSRDCFLDRQVPLYSGSCYTRSVCRVKSIPVTIEAPWSAEGSFYSSISWIFLHSSYLHSRQLSHPKLW